jgi:hypothetical protein
MMLPVMRTFRTRRPATLAAVPSSTMTNAISACCVGVTSQPKTLATKPAENIATDAIATMSVHI